MKSLFQHITMAVAAIAIAILATGCNDSFMDKFPETSITEKVFFSSPADLESYTNGMYDYISSSYNDAPSDNMLYVENPSIYRMMRGEITPEIVGKWSWTSVRYVNFMLARAGQVHGDQGEINHYVGLARLIRGLIYYSKVKDYSDVPWYSRDLQTTDIDLLYKPQDSRALVVDSIMADMQFAAANMENGTSKTRIMKAAALGYLARTAMHEGTFRKYHPELNLNDGDRFLNIAIDACTQIMNMGRYSLSTVSVSGLPAYQSLFCSLDLTQNPEMILMEDYDKALGRMHNAQSQFDYNTGCSRSLMEDYLVIKDGKALPFHTINGYATKPFTEVFEDRDPRMSQTIMPPGTLDITSGDVHRPKQNLGGYAQLKYRPLSVDQMDWGHCYTDLPVIRYAEILLIYAEAKAELGILTQDDIDKTINLIRGRVGMPPASLGDWLSNIDPVQAERYCNVNSSQRGAVLEIRRERRIELAMEGFRYGDIFRWGLGNLLEDAPEGAYISGMGYHDVTGDGEPDIAFVATKADAAAIPADDKTKYKLTIYALEGNTIALSEGDHGYIYLISQKGKFHFESPKYYYWPVAKKDIVINENLYQNPFWK